MRRTSKGNPFTDAFVKKEIDAYGAEPYNQNGIEVVLKYITFMVAKLLCRPCKYTEEYLIGFASGNP